MSARTLAPTPRWRTLIAGAAASALVLSGCTTTGDDTGSTQTETTTINPGGVGSVEPTALDVLPTAITDNLTLCQEMDGEGAFTAEVQQEVPESFCIWNDEDFPHSDEDVDPTSQTLSFSTADEVINHIESIEAGDPEDPLSQSFGWEEIWNEGGNEQPRVVVYHWPEGTVSNVKLVYPQDSFAARWQVTSTVTPEEAKEFLARLGVL
ncbi:hypothetical protein NYP18_14460 [Corynebacterium sp. YIM 101645]|uniref:DUF3558 domain-containing protein n=1 Tax=Corynebacterium lemuris TaxID=1859292 RepID=A0ABT2G3T2_9CORY|nr:hypothetical protein [Corynebacterium lemuris]MCS5480844.1 hypothetical protein [Corynebacterium lemuris]